MINCFVSIIPIMLYLIVLYAMDGFMLARWRLLAGMLFWGLLSMLLMLGIVHGYRLLNNGEAWQAPWISPILEELLKCLPLLVLIFRKKIAFYAETQIYGQMVGGGFALGENILYTSSLTDMSVTTALIRGLDTALMHMGCTALLASLMLIPIHYMSEHKSVKGIFAMDRLPVMLGCCIVPVPSILIHLAHNLNLVSPFVQLIVIVVGFFLLFMLVEHINDTLIIRWMDVSITEDIKLLQALKKGTLLDTTVEPIEVQKAAKYLIAIRSKFDPLVFFDMCVYVSLYLELLISAKSQMMLREAGLEDTLDEATQRLTHEKKQELRSISRRLPSLSHQLLRPLLHASNQNKWAIDHL